MKLNQFKNKTLTLGALASILSIATLAVSALSSEDAAANSGGAPQAGRVARARGHRLVVRAPQPSLRAVRQLSPWVPRLQAWCDEVQMILNEGLLEANNAVNYMDYASAIETLRQTLQDARDSITFTGNARRTLTLKLIDQGIEVANQVSVNIDGDTSGLPGLWRYLFQYVSFIKNSATSFDRYYYIPHMYGCGGSWGGGCNVQRSDFERRLAEIGRKQLEFVARDLTIWDGDRFVPAGDPRVFLTAASIFPRLVAEEMTFSSLAYAKACDIARLRRFAARVDRVLYPMLHSSGQVRVPLYGSFPMAIDGLTRELKFVAHNMSRVSCFNTWADDSVVVLPDAIVEAPYEAGAPIVSGPVEEYYPEDEYYPEQ